MRMLVIRNNRKVQRMIPRYCMPGSMIAGSLVKKRSIFSGNAMHMSIARDPRIIAILRPVAVSILMASVFFAPQYCDVRTDNPELMPPATAWTI